MCRHRAEGLWLKQTSLAVPWPPALLAGAPPPASQGHGRGRTGWCPAGSHLAHCSFRAHLSHLRVHSTCPQADREPQGAKAGSVPLWVALHPGHVMSSGRGHTVTVRGDDHRPGWERTGAVLMDWQGHGHPTAGSQPRCFSASLPPSASETAARVRGETGAGKRTQHRPSH